MDLLGGLKIVEYCAAPAGAACARELARWGADVLSLEPPHGSPLRDAPPLLERDGQRRSMLHLSLSQGKTIEPFSPERLNAALDNADIFLTDAPLTEIQDAAEGRPRLIVVHCSPFGASGPYAHYRGGDLIVQSLSGFAATQGLPDRQPLAAPAAIIPRAAGVLAAAGAIAALLERSHSGRGQWIELAEIEAACTLTMAVRSEFAGQPILRAGGPEGWAEVLPTADGFVTLSAWSRDALRAAPAAFGVEPPPDELLDGPGAAVADKAAALDYFRPILAERSSEEVFNRLAELAVNLAWHRTAGDLLDDPHLNQLGFVRQIDAGELGALRAAGPPARIIDPGATGAAGAAQTDSAPHPDDFARRPRPNTSSGPLDGLRVVDFTHAWLGPYASALLADLGAEVIKIEGPRRPDLWRHETRWPMPAAAPDAHPLNIRANFHMANRNKRVVSLALDTEQGRQLALELLARADLALENFRPRVLENLRLTHDHMRAVNPRITLVSFSGFGAGGPYSNYRANGGSTEGNAGWDMLLGYPGQHPQLLGTMQADPICGAQMALVALAALHRRAQDHRGGLHIDGSMFEAAVGYIEEHALLASAGGQPVARNGNRRPDQAPHECFPCQGDDEWIAIAAPDDDAWSALLTVARKAANESAQSEAADKAAPPTAAGEAAQPEAADAGAPLAAAGEAAQSESEAASAGAQLDRPEWRTAAGRLADIDALEAAIAQWTRHWDAQTLQARLQRAGVPAGIVHSTLSVLADPHLAARGWWQYLEHPDYGVRRHGGPPWRFSRTPAQITRPAPRLGEHTEEILTNTLNHAKSQITKWQKANIIAPLTTTAD